VLSRIHAVTNSWSLRHDVPMRAAGKAREMQRGGFGGNTATGGPEAGVRQVYANQGIKAKITGFHRLPMAVLLLRCNRQLEFKYTVPLVRPTFRGTHRV